MIIVIIDDHRLTSELLKTSLEIFLMGKIYIFHSYQAFENEKIIPDVVMLDFQLERTQGSEHIETLHKMGAIVIGISLDEQNRELFLKAGADGFILKTENPLEIIHMIQEVLSKKIVL